MGDLEASVGSSGASGNDPRGSVGAFERFCEAWESAVRQTMFLLSVIARLLFLESRCKTIAGKRKVRDHRTPIESDIAKPLYA